MNSKNKRNVQGQINYWNEQFLNNLAILKRKYNIFYYNLFHFNLIFS